MKSKKIIGIYFEGVSRELGPQYKSTYYKKAYEQLYSYIYKEGVTPIIIHDEKDSYIKNGDFSWYWEPVFDKRMVFKEFVLCNKRIKIPLLFDKGRFRAEDMPVINPKAISRICSDKFLTYQFLPAMHAKSSFVSDTSKLGPVLKEFSSHKELVIKSVDSSGGDEVYIGRPGDYKDIFTYPLIVQEFIEGKGGIPKIINGRHDLRIAIFDGEVIYGRLRQPPIEGKIASLQFGGTERMLAMKDIPKEPIEMAKMIDKKFNTTQHRHFAVDFTRGRDRWYVIELNSWPGLVDADMGSEFMVAMKLLAKKLANCTKDTAIKY